MKSHFPQVCRTTRMAQLPRRMGQCQEWMRFGTSKRRMPTESRTHFSGRPWWYATATDTTLQANRRPYSGAIIAIATTALSCLYANHSAILASNASGSSFWYTQLSLQEAGSCINGFSRDNRQYYERVKSGFRLGPQCQLSQSPSHIRSGRFLKSVVMTKWKFWTRGWKITGEMETNAEGNSDRC